MLQPILAMSHHTIISFPNTGPKYWIQQRKVHCVWVSWQGHEDSWSSHSSKVANPGQKGLKPKVKAKHGQQNNGFKSEHQGSTGKLMTLMHQNLLLCTDPDRDPKRIFLWSCVFIKLVKVRCFNWWETADSFHSDLFTSRFPSFSRPQSGSAHFENWIRGSWIGDPLAWV